MNHVYRLTWNESQQQYVAAPETARGRHKQGGRTRRRLISAAVAAALMGGAPGVFAEPTGGQIRSGAATIAPSGTTLTVNQLSQKLVLNWQSFSIAGDETVNFVQPGASAIALNRVLGSDPSAIYGKLNANGQVFLVNPNGILFGKGAQVNVGGLVASTLDLSDADFLSGKRTFRAGSGASVGNLGRITADGGYIAFLGGTVSNQGTLQANLGTVALAAGNQATLDFAGDKLINVQVDQGALHALAENGQLIEANGGSVILTAKAADHLVSAVVNNNGLIMARTMQDHGGVISLLGDMQAGEVRVGGTLDASAPDGGKGGFIETSAARVTVGSDARVTTAAAGGRYGSWLIDPHDYTVAASGGDITGAVLGNNLGTTDVILQSSNGAAAGSGNVNVNDAVTWNANTTLTLTASNHVNVNAPITATGAAAGLAMNPNTANGADAASGTGAFRLGAGAAINLPNVSPASKTALVIGGTPYTVINSVGVAGDTSATTLQGVNGKLSGNYALGSNIDATGTAAWNGKAGFTPIAGGTDSFAGTFDGMGHTINGLTIKTPASTYMGLFGTVGAGGLVQNLGLVGGSVNGNTNGFAIGALAGANYGTLNNVYSTAGVTGSGTSGGEVGALVGYNKGTISNAYAAGSVNGASSLYVGGLAGLNDGVLSDAFSTGSVTGGAGSEVGGLTGENNGTISHAYATGKTSGATDVGGLVGVNFGSLGDAYATGDVSGSARTGGLAGTNGGTIAYAYAKGSVSGSGNVSIMGGLVGQNNSNGSISNVYATGSVSGTNSAGGLVGSNKGAISAGYWNSDVKPIGIGSTGTTSTATGVAGLTTAQMRTAANFAGFVFVSAPGEHRWVMIDGDGTLNNAGGAAGAATPMLASEWAGTVNNAHQLQLMTLAPSANYVIGKRIDASATAGGKDIWDSTGFIPVGNAAIPFSGVFNGAGQTISGLTINTPSSDRVGLFGALGTGAVKNVGLEGASVTGRNYVGALVGNNDGGAISNVYANGSISGSNNVGALVGRNNGGAITNAYATGSVTGKLQVGGLAGANLGTIVNAYATGSVSGAVDVGALVGTNSGTISNGFWNRELNPIGIETNTGTMTAWGLTAAQLQTQANFTSATSANGNVNPAWDFGATWIMYDGYTAPLLRSFMTPLTVTANNTVKTYDRQVSAMNGVTYSATPDARLLGTASFGGTARDATNVGTYTITPGGLYSTQTGYAINFVNGTLTLNPAALTVAGTVVADKVYDGSTVATLDKGSLVGVVAGDTVTLNQSGMFATKNAGAKISVVATDTLSGASAGNYILTEPNGLSASITPRQLTVLGTAAATKVYDGTTVASLTGGTLDGVVAGDTVTLKQAGVFATRNAGTAIAVTATDSLNGSSAGNYSLLQPTGLSANITPKQLTVGGKPNGDKIYDGTSVVTLKGGSINGIIAGDTVSLDQLGTFLDKNAGNAKTLNYANSLTGADRSNYGLSATGGSITANILAKDLVVGATTADNKTYDGTTTAQMNASLSGFIAGDTVNLVQSGAFADKNVGKAKVVKYQNSLSGADSGNYHLLSAGGATAADVLVKMLTVTGSTVADKVYDGTATATVTGGALNGLVNGEKLRLSQAGVFVTKNAGIAIPVTITDTLSGTGASNYLLVQPASLTARIAPKQLKASAPVAANKVYDGTTDVTLKSGKISSGIVAGDTVSLVQAARFADKNAGKRKTVIYSSSLTGIDAGNYFLPPSTATVAANITAFTLTLLGGTVAADKTYDGTTAAWVSGGMINGVIGKDVVALAQAGKFTSKTIGAGKTVLYTNTLNGKDAGNYMLAASDRKGKTTAEILAP